MRRPLVALVFGCALLVLASRNAAWAQSFQDGCTNLMVFVLSSSSQGSRIQKVECSSGYTIEYNPQQSFSATAPALLTFSQDLSGPNCTITVAQGGVTAVLQVQQNECVAEAGDITASVTSGPAVLQGTVGGSYADGIPGTVFFLFNPAGAAKP